MENSFNSTQGTGFNVNDFVPSYANKYANKGSTSAKEFEGRLFKSYDNKQRKHQELPPQNSFFCTTSDRSSATQLSKQLKVYEPYASGSMLVPKQCFNPAHTEAPSANHGSRGPAENHNKSSR